MGRMKKLLFLFIVLLSIYVRFWGLGDIPEGFHSDEAAFGYNAYSILKTGKDEYGVFFPLSFQSFGDYKAALYAYFTVPFVAIFGLTEWAVRVPTAVFGVLWVCLAYLVVKQMTGKNDIALITMALAALSPSTVLLSRVQSDPFVSVFFILLGFYFFLMWVKHQKCIVFVFLFCIAWAASTMTYVLPRIFLLLFMPFVLYWFYPLLKPSGRRLYLCVMVGIFLAIAVLTNSVPKNRLDQVNVFHTMDVILPLEEKIREDGVMGVPALTARIFHNKAVEYGRYLALSYSQYFSFQFLYYEANQPLRETIPGVGVFLFAELPFFLAGLYYIFIRKVRWGYFFFLWLVGVPALLAFTKDETPNIHRFFLANFPFHIITAYGIVSLYKFFNAWKQKGYVLVVGLLFFANCAYMLHQLFIHQPIHKPFYRGYAYKPLVVELKNRVDSYDVVVSQKVLEHMLFFWQVDPKTYQDMGSPRDENGRWMGKYFFVPDACPSELAAWEEMFSDKRVLYVDKGDCQVNPEDVLMRICWRDGSPAFLLVEKAAEPTRL